MLFQPLTVGGRTTSANAGALAAVDWEHHSGDELGFVGSEEQGGEGDIPGGAHFLTERNESFALGDQLRFRNATRLGDALNRHGRIHEAGHDHVCADVVLGIFHGDLVGEGVHAGLGSFVSQNICGANCGDGGDVDDRTAALFSHYGQHAPAREEHALEVDGHDFVPGLLAETQDSIVAGSDTDIVVQDIHAAVGFHGSADEGAAIVFARDVCLEAKALAALSFDEGFGFLDGFAAEVNQSDASAFAGEEDGGGAAIADGIARCLACADDDRDFVLKPHRP
jgi:hypothetical protein